MGDKLLGVGIGTGFGTDFGFWAPLDGFWGSKGVPKPVPILAPRHFPPSKRASRRTFFLLVLPTTP